LKLNDFMSKFYFFILVFFSTLLGVLIVEIFVIPNLISLPIFKNFKFFERLQKEVILNPVQEIIVSEKELIPKVFSNISQSVVLIGNKENDLKCAISITSDGILLTKKDYIDKEKSIAYFSWGKEKIKILKEDPKNNLVLIKIDKSNLKTVPFLEDKDLLVGNTVFLLGKNDKETILNSGLIRSLNEDSFFINFTDKNEFLYCPIFTLKGELAGIAVSFDNNFTKVLPIWKIRESLGF